jgi:hypothetical protein
MLPPHVSCGSPLLFFLSLAPHHGITAAVPRPQVPSWTHRHPTPLLLQLACSSPPGALLHPHMCTPRLGARCSHMLPRAAGPPRLSSWPPPRACLRVLQLALPAHGQLWCSVAQALLVVATPSASAAARPRPARARLRLDALQRMHAHLLRLLGRRAHGPCATASVCSPVRPLPLARTAPSTVHARPLLSGPRSPRPTPPGHALLRPRAAPAVQPPSEGMRS